MNDNEFSIPISIDVFNEGITVTENLLDFGILTNFSVF